ncbi:MAG: gliding motility-associated C-terminal domain-containing protein, partial [Flavobacteriales bacterium]
NDFFVIDGLQYFPGSKLTIFNRWGNIVLEDEDYKNNWSPIDVSEGTYYYILELAMPDLTTEFYSGHFTMLNKE